MLLNEGRFELPIWVIKKLERNSLQGSKCAPWIRCAIGEMPTAFHHARAIKGLYKIEKK